MNKKKIGYLLAALLGAGAVGAAADELYVIASPTVNMSAEEVRDVFLGNKQFADSVLLTPVDNNAARAAFVNRALGMDLSRYATSWTKKSFREGLRPPVSKASDLEVLDFVRRTPGAVGYVSTTPSGVKIIAHF